MFELIRKLLDRKRYDSDEEYLMVLIAISQAMRPFGF